MEQKLVKTQVTFGEYATFINNVVNTVFETDEDGSMEYLPELYDIALKIEFAKNYLGYFDEGKEFDEIYNDCVGIIVENYMSYNFQSLENEKINTKQYCAMTDAIHNKVEFIKQQILNSKKDSLDELLQSITNFIKNMESKFDGFDMSQLENLGQLGKKIEGLSDTKLVNALVKELGKGKSNNIKIEK